MHLTRCYKNVTIYPSLIVIFLTTIYSYNVDRYYKSEWFRSVDVMFFSIFFSVFYAIALSILSLTIFLNKYERVKQSKLLGFLSWFLLPFGFMAFVIIKNISLMISNEVDEVFDFIFILLLNIPYIAALIWNYIKFSRSVR
jgi:hypothetical protein